MLDAAGFERLIRTVSSRFAPAYDPTRVALTATNLREYECSHPSCFRKALAKKLCNVHYLRARSGQDMDAPIQRKMAVTKQQCLHCGIPITSKGAWGYCVKHYKAKRQKEIKATIVAAFGNRCFVCDNEYPARVFDFHHLRDKEYSISELINNAKIKVLAEELTKCIMLCANCHRIEHEGDVI